MATSEARSLAIADSLVCLRPASLSVAARWVRSRAASMSVAMSTSIHLSPWKEASVVGAFTVGEASPLDEEGAYSPRACFQVRLRQHDRPIGRLRAGDPGFCALENVGSAFAPRRCLYRRRVGACLRLSQGECANGLSSQERTYHGLLLFCSVL